VSDDTLQSVLAAFFREEAAWRQDRADRSRHDLRERTSAKWLAELAAFVEQLGDDDPGISTLAGFRWTLQAFAGGAGPQSRTAAGFVGFGGTRDHPDDRPPRTLDLERNWATFVNAAQRDARDVERLVAILEARFDKLPRSRVRAALGKFQSTP
jgi:hypothetical protein